jgi:hypothetical protein
MQFLAVGSDLRMLTTRAEAVVRTLFPDAAKGQFARY